MDTVAATFVAQEKITSKSYFISLFLKTVSYPINLGGANYE